ncbi:MAG: isoprenyl transferase [Proteobacteria bacterium]|nr:isoprenyl transferase [Pseudomonadota bacterium]
MSASDHDNLDINKLPLHVAVIMDGNGRWAQKRLLNRVKGHEKGSESVRVIVKTCRELNIPYLTLYAFSTENWDRPKAEVSALMTLLNRFLKTEEKLMLDNNIRLNAMGQIERLPDTVRKTLFETMEKTRNNNAMQLNLALSYGSRAEIVDMVKKIATDVKAGRLDPGSISSDMIPDYLYTKDIPDPDLLIRTSGEMRISNFLLWQIAYSEIYFTDTLWPDFGREEFIHILEDFQGRERRYGKVPA